MTTPTTIVANASTNALDDCFDAFCSADSLQDTLASFGLLCRLLGALDFATHDDGSGDHCNDHIASWSNAIRRGLRHNHQLSTNYWRSRALLAKLDKLVLRPEYNNQQVTRGLNAVVIGCGPCGLRCAIELALLGANVIILEKRTSFSRNNVIHLWPYLIHDLRALGAKTFYGKFCAGQIDHISIRKLQCILLKVALLFGCRVMPGVAFKGLVEPSSTTFREESPDVNCNGDHHQTEESHASNNDITSLNNGSSSSDSSSSKWGWRVLVEPSHLQDAFNDLDVDVLIGADGKRSCLGFSRKELRCRLAIAITANFINYRTKQEARIEEISGVTSVFRQDLFAKLSKATQGVELENVVYYKDDTHYFVMTAKKASLLAKGVLKQDFEASDQLLHADNIDQSSLQTYARQVADFLTQGQLPRLDFAVNEASNQPDVAIFDFTRMFAADHSCKLSIRNEFPLFRCLIGDGLYEPFWPTGSGCALGFLSALDAAWAVGQLTTSSSSSLRDDYHNHPLTVLAQRESVYQRLSQTTPGGMPCNFADYSLDPRTRYTQVDLGLISPIQVRHLFDDPSLDQPTLFRLARSLSTSSVANGNNNQLMGWNGFPSCRHRLSSQSNRLLLLSHWIDLRLSFYYIVLSPFYSQRLSPLSTLTPTPFDLLCLIHSTLPSLVPSITSALLGGGDNSPSPPLNDDLKDCIAKLLKEHFNFNQELEFHKDVVGDGRLSPSSALKVCSCLARFGGGVVTQEFIQLMMSCVRDKLRPNHTPFLNNDNDQSQQFPYNKSFDHRHRLNTDRIDRLLNDRRPNSANALFASPLDSQQQPPLHTKWLIGKGSLLKRRDKLLATVNDPASAKRDNHRFILKRQPMPHRFLNSSSSSSSSTTSSLTSSCSSLMANGSHKPGVNGFCKGEKKQSLYRPRPSTASTNLCIVCSLPVYLTERQPGFDKQLHRRCLRCSECGIQLQLSTATYLRACDMSDKVARFLCLSHAHYYYLNAQAGNSAQDLLASQTASPVNPLLSDSAKIYSKRHRNGRPSRSPPPPSPSPASLLNRMNAGQFPFTRSSSSNNHHSDRLVVRQSTNGQRPSSVALVVNEGANHNDLGRTLTPIPHKSALLAGLDGEDESISRLIASTTRWRLNYASSQLSNNYSDPPSTSSSDSSSVKLSSSSSSNHSTSSSPSNSPSPSRPIGSRRQQAMAQRRRHWLVKKRKKLIGRDHHAGGIRDEPAPGEDCCLAGHPGLPECERRAYWELNTARWPRQEGANDPSISDHLAPAPVSTNQSPASSSIQGHQSRPLAAEAKQRFYMAEPQPFVIDSRQFKSRRNLEASRIIDLSDCSERLGELLGVDCLRIASSLVDNNRCRVATHSTTPSIQHSSLWLSSSPSSTSLSDCSSSDHNHHEQLLFITSSPTASPLPPSPNKNNDGDPHLSDRSPSPVSSSSSSDDLDSQPCIRPRQCCSPPRPSTDRSSHSLST